MEMLQPPNFEIKLGDFKLNEVASCLESINITSAGCDVVRVAIFKPTDPVVSERIIRIGLQHSWFGSISCEMRGDFCEIRITGDEITQTVMSQLGLPYGRQEGA